MLVPIHWFTYLNTDVFRKKSSIKCIIKAQLHIAEKKLKKYSNFFSPLCIKQICSSFVISNSHGLFCGFFHTNKSYDFPTVNGVDCSTTYWAYFLVNKLRVAEKPCEIWNVGYRSSNVFAMHYKYWCIGLSVDHDLHYVPKMQPDQYYSHNRFVDKVVLLFKSTIQIKGFKVTMMGNAWSSWMWRVVSCYKPHWRSIRFHLCTTRYSYWWYINTNTINQRNRLISSNVRVAVKCQDSPATEDESTITPPMKGLGKDISTESNRNDSQLAEEWEDSPAEGNKSPAIPQNEWIRDGHFNWITQNDCQ